MDTVSSAPRSTARPTQEYYVPRKLLECGRGPTTISSGQKNTNSSQKREDSKSPRETNNNGFVGGKDDSRNQKRSEQGSRNNKSAKQRASPTGDKANSPKEKSSRLKAEPIVQHLKKLTVSEPRVVVAKPKALQRPNPFCPTPSHNDGCICERPKTHVICKRCSYECTGRVVRVCSSHPKKLDLLDLRECQNSLCRSIQILELNQEYDKTG